MHLRVQINQEMKVEIKPSKSITFLLQQALFTILFFWAGRLIFSFYHNDIEAFSAGERACSIFFGLPLDLNVTAWILLLPLAVTTLAHFRQGLPLRKILGLYYVLVALLAAVTITADIVMYEFWKFKLSAVVLSYAASPEGASSSVSPMFILSRVGSGLLSAALLAYLFLHYTPKRLETKNHKMLLISWVLCLCCLYPFPIRSAYYSSSITKNHSAVNPIRSFVSSIRTGSMDTWYQGQTDEQCARVFEGLYPENTEDITDTLLNTARPNILLIQWESLGSQFVEEMGGLKNVTPYISRMIPDGIFWTNYYSNSFRTDRGTVSTYSGYLSYPDVGLMKDTRFHPHINSVAKTLNQEGYTTAYLYPGAMTNMGKGTYLADMQFTHLLDNNYFSADELDSPWGAHDATSAKKTMNWINEHSKDQNPWFMVYQTVSSHEPFDVPYERLEDKVQNAFAYTDECVGKLIEELKQSEVWNNTLVILIPDHGYLYQQTLQDPQFFHSPMIWTGGAIRQPRQMDIIMNQSDIAATLLSQMQIPHQDYVWSRNVLSKNYTNPFAYCNYPAGFLFVDNNGYTMYDLMADTPSASQEKDGKTGDGAYYHQMDRIAKGKAILQTSHRKLQELLDK